jgi:hypothetical protein
VTPGRSRQRIATAALALVAVVVACFGLVSAPTTRIRVYDAGAGEPAVSAAARPAASAPANRGAVSRPEGLAHGYDDRSQLARASARPVGEGLAPNTTRLASRADDLHGALDPIAQTRRTTAVMGTRQGPDVLAGGVRDLTPAQRAMARPGDVLGRLPGEHAEITALKAAGEAGLTPQGIATTTNICPACRVALEEAGATVTGPRSAWWWSL